MTEEEYTGRQLDLPSLFKVTKMYAEKSVAIATAAVVKGDQDPTMQLVSCRKTLELIKEVEQRLINQNILP